VADNTYRDGAADIANNEASFINDGGFAIDQVKMNAVRAYFEFVTPCQCPQHFVS
jgi:alkaline phosphatase D